MYKVLLVIITIVLFSGCTNKELYNFGQSYQKSDCAQNVINLEQYDQCMLSNKMTFEDYQKERESVIKEVSEQ